MNISRTLQTVAKHLPQAPAISFEGRQLTYGAFEHQVGCIAGALRGRHGLGGNDRVALAMENSLEFLPALYGVWRAGLSAVPVNAKLHPKELAWIIADSGAKLVFATQGIADKMSELGGQGWPQVIVAGSRDWMAMLFADPIVEAPRDPDEEAWVFYTSGTTGRPKGAMLTHRNLLFSAHAYYADIDFVDQRDCMLHAAPLSHGAGMYALPHIARGSHQIIFPDRSSPSRSSTRFARTQNVSMFAAPTMVSRLLNHPGAGAIDTRGLKTMIYGGAPMYVADLKRGIEMFGPEVLPAVRSGRGADDDHRTRPRHCMPMPRTRSTSSALARPVSPAPASRSGSSARTGRSCRWARSARSSPRSDCVMKGYWNNPEATARSLRDGWLWTGDLGVARCRRFPHHQGPLQGHDHLRRLEHLSARDRGGAAHPRGRARMRGGEPPARRLGRGGHRVHRQAARHGGGGGRARPALPRQHRPLQAAEGLPVRRTTAEEQLRQGPEDRAARLAESETPNA